MTGWWLVSYIVLWGVVAALGVLVVALAREIGALHLRLGPRGALEIDGEGPELGAVVPPIDVEDIAGAPATLGGAGPRRLLLFASPTCEPCRDVVPAVGVLADVRLRTAIVTDAPRTLLDPWRRLGVTVLLSTEAFTAYSVPGTPFAVVLGEDGRVLAKGTANNPEQLEGLVATADRRVAEAVPA